MKPRLRRREFSDTSNPDLMPHSLFMNLVRVTLAMMALILATQHFFLEEWTVAALYFGGVGLACNALEG